MATSARKFGEDAYGTWDRDAHNLPCYVFNPLDMPLWPHTPRHVLGTGRALLLCDAAGTFRLVGSTRQLEAADRQRGMLSVLSLDLHCNGRSTRFMQSSLADSEKHPPCVRWGVGHAVYTQTVVLDENENELDVSVDITALPGTTVFLAEVMLDYRGAATQTLRLQISSDVEAPHIASPVSAFLRDGIAIYPDDEALRGDSFLAGGPDWTADARLSTLILERSVALESGSSLRSSVVFGVSHTCSIAWARRQWEGAQRDAALRAWGEAVVHHRPRAPELWMQEEIQWATGRFLSLTGTAPGAGTPDCACMDAGDDPVGRDLTRDRDLGQELLTCIPLWRWNPALAHTRLIALAAKQDPQGSFGSATDRVDPRHDRSHREICFLAACATVLHQPNQSELLDDPIPFRGGDAVTLWEHIVRTVDWVRDTLGTGSHGLIRMLSGDLNPALDRVGIAGAGESMLNTAMMVYALHPLVDWARRRNQEPLAAEWSAWERTLREAVSEAYGRNAFVRAYTDTGDPVGDGTDTAFAEAQAWAVIARCGTDTQRAEALDTLVRSSGDTGLPALTVPYGVPPQDVSSWRTAPGDGWNGGFCAVTAAWCVWALAAERRMADALAEWERATIRRRAALNPKTAVPWLTNVAETASHLAGGRAGGSVLGDSAQSGNVPDILSVAWSEFALHMALRE